MTLPTPPLLDSAAEPALRALIEGKAKPPGALGRIEDLAVQLALIAGSEAPSAARAELLVFAGDHGLTEAGVSAYPASVTQAMVATLLAGRASANAFARAVGCKVTVVDAGVAAELPPHAAMIAAKVRPGTRNALVEPALTPAEMDQALSRGAEIGRAAAAHADVVLLGEMGIGNSASAALLLHRLAPAPLDECIGLGAGHDGAGLARKRAALRACAARTDVLAPLDVLAEFGGLEIAMMAGAAIGAAAAGRPVLVDGFISGSAALAAVRLRPEVRDYLVFSHHSAERGHALMLRTLDADPLLDLDLRLGEGTGALLALPLLRAACELLTGVASLDDVLAGRL
jgi:nicotinate-nucleotide--dimethylbenzimidazole phosphoribosyltransferase